MGTRSIKGALVNLGSTLGHGAWVELRFQLVHPCRAAPFGSAHGQSQGRHEQQSQQSPWDEQPAIHGCRWDLANLFGSCEALRACGNRSESAPSHIIGPPDSSPLIVCCTICTGKFVHVLGCGAQQGRCRMETLQQSLELVQVLFGQFPKPRACSPHPRDSWSAALPFAAADVEETPHLWSHVTIIVSWSILWPMSCARSTFATAFPETLYEAHHPTSSWTCLKNIYNRHWHWCSCSGKTLAKRTWDPLALSGNAEPVNHSGTDKARESN